MNYHVELKKIIAEIPEYIPNEFDHKIKNQTQFYIYGAGFMGCKYAELLAENGYQIIGFFETNCTSPGALRYQIPVFPVTYKDALVIISSFAYFSQMKNMLLQNGFADELSKQLVLDKIKYLTLKPEMKAISSYFNFSIFEELSDEVFVDGGCFDGETTREFCAISNQKYRKVYCFEPSKQHCELIAKNLEGFERVEIVNKCLYSKDAILQFKDWGIDQWNAVDDFFMGHEWNGPNFPYQIVKVPVTSLDLFFQDKPVEDYPTIIKLDIEGCEREALLGMKRVLNTTHPKLIICAYHKIEDFFELTSTIKELCPGYKLQLRHYTDTVLESIIFGYFPE